MNFIVHSQSRINAFLNTCLSEVQVGDSRLKQAMAYSLLSGGKRIRPCLVYATANSLELDHNVADYLAAAIEMIHAYSLIHDDLPAMDDDDLRRGQPTNHIAFDEATAILAGDALQSLAFETMAQAPLDPSIVVLLIRLLARESGLSGMAGGQSLDLISENEQVNLSQLQQIHAAKTGALLNASVMLAANSVPTLAFKDNQLFNRFSNHLGMAFQIIDDILDVTQDTATLGKPAHSDIKNNKSTYPGLLGLDEARNQASLHIDKAYHALADLPY
ncbi:polyprenyl synthetase family protein, partial [Marinicella sediminis]